MKSYLITGASRGIGRAIALKLAQADPEGTLILVGRKKESLEALLRELPGTSRHQIVEADLSDAAGLCRALRGAGLDRSNLAAVIANAGVGGENSYGSGDRWDEIIGTNLSGTYRLIQECLPALRESTEKFKNIVILSSILARIGVPKHSAYCASKAGLLGLSRSLAVELAPENILVNAICPGWVDTEMSAEGLHGIAAASGLSFDEARVREMGRVPLGKMSRPEEIAALVAYLLSPGQVSMTGQTIDLNNGAWMG